MTPYEEHIDQILRQAGDLLEKSHWYRGRYLPEERLDGARGGEGSYCAITALLQVANDTEYAHARATLAKRIGVRGESIIFWNDSPTRTKTEVVRALRGEA